MSALRKIELLLLSFIVLFSSGLFGCGSATEQLSSSAAPSFNVPWPPPAAANRHASADVVTLTGADFAEVGGTAFLQGTVMTLHASPQLAYAIYTVDGFTTSVQPSEVEVDFAVTPVSPGDGTALWVGLGNYARGVWEWERGIPALYSKTITSPSNYFSESTGILAIAVVLWGPGSVAVPELRISRSGDPSVPVPDGLTGTAELSAVHLTWNPVVNVDGYNIYRSESSDFSNPQKQNLTLLSSPAYDDTDIFADTTYYYRVTAYKYKESGLSDMYWITTPTEDVPRPKHLTGTADVGAIHLDWDDIVGEGFTYNVYRDISPAFNNPVKLNSSPVDVSNYDDLGMQKQKMFYYCVTTQHFGESGYSNMVDIYSPAADLPAPLNPHASQIDFDYFRAAWSWEIENPSQFYVYYSEVPDFPIDLDAHSTNTLGTSRSLKITDLTPGTTYYFRVVARNGTGFGRMTDDIAVTTRTYWEWTAEEEIGLGTAPMVATIADGDFTVAYINDYNVDVARRNAGVWTVETVLQESDAPGQVERGGFGEYLDLTSNSTGYALAAYAVATDDLWVALGSPGGTWDKQLVDGDGAAGLGHTASGEYLRIAASPDEYSVIYFDAPANSVMLRSHPAGSGSWSGASTLVGAGGVPLFHSLCYEGNNLMALYLDRTNMVLNLGDRDAGWVWSDIAQSSPEVLGAYNTMQKIGTEYWVTAENETTGDYYVIHGSGDTWETLPVDTGGSVASPRGVNSQLTTYGAGLVTVYYGYSPNRWYISFYDGATWSAEALQLASYTPGMSMDIEELNGELYLLFVNNSDGKVKCLKGLPPT